MSVSQLLPNISNSTTAIQMYVPVGHFSCSEANLQVFVSVSQFMPKILVADLLYKCGSIGHLVVKIEAF